MTAAELRRHVATRALGALTAERYARLRQRGQSTGDQVRDLVVMENLEHDLLVGATVHHRRYGLSVDGAA